MERINSKDAHGKTLHGMKNGKRVFRKAHYNGSDNLPRTPITTKWLNDVQLEILSVIEDSSIVPKSGKAQMIESIKSLISKAKDECVEINKNYAYELADHIRDEMNVLRDDVLEANKRTERLESRLLKNKKTTESLQSKLFENTKATGRLNTELTKTNANIDLNKKKIESSTASINQLENNQKRLIASRSEFYRFKSCMKKIIVPIMDAIEWVSLAGLRPGWEDESKKVSRAKWTYFNALENKEF